MGADIHCYIEYRRKGSRDWLGFGGRINPGRDYLIFGLLAQVRGDGPRMVPDRGMPTDAGRESSGDDRLYVVEPTEADPGERHCKRSQAEDWVARGYSKWCDEKKRWVTNPDWHSHTWATPDEWEAVLTRAAADRSAEGLRGISPEYHAMLAAMRSLESSGLEARVVFWFDN